MTSAPANPTLQELLSEFTEASDGAVLLLNADLDEDCFHEVRSSLNRIGPQSSLSVILNSPGGSIEDAFRIAKALRLNCGKLRVIVPGMAKSAATLIALAADTIELGSFGELGPLDPQIPDPTGGRWRSSLETIQGLQYLRAYYIESLNLITLELLQRAQMDLAYALNQVQRLLPPITTPLYQNVDFKDLSDSFRLLTVAEYYAREVMRRWSPVDFDSIPGVVRTLVWRYPSHGYIIDLAEANDIGLSNAHPLAATLESLSASIIAYAGIAASAPFDAANQARNTATDEGENECSECNQT